MTKEEKLEKAIEWLENAIYNVDNIKKGLPIHDLVKDQIKSAIKAIENKDISDVFGGGK